MNVYQVFYWPASVSAQDRTERSLDCGAVFSSPEQAVRFASKIEAEGGAVAEIRVHEVDTPGDPVPFLKRSRRWTAPRKPT